MFVAVATQNIYLIKNIQWSRLWNTNTFKHKFYVEKLRLKEGNLVVDNYTVKKEIVPQSWSCISNWNHWT